MMNYFIKRIFAGNVAGSTFCQARIKRAAALSLSVSFMMVSLNSCFIDVGPYADPDEQYINVSVAVPGQIENPLEEEGTRHGTPVPGVGDENKISTLAFIVFKSDGTLEVNKIIAIDASGHSTDPLWDSANSAMRLLLTMGVKEVYVVANWSITGNTEMTALSTIMSIANLQAHTRVFNTGIMPVNPPVMTGHRSITLYGGETDIEIELTRQVARVDVYPQISANADALGATVSIEGIKFLNMAQISYLFPRNNSGPATGTWDQTSFLGSTAGIIVSVAGGTIAPTLYGHYYIPEHFGTSSAHTIMVIHAKYNTKDSYYFININGQANSLPGIYAVERNHSYKYNIIVQGVGSDSPSPTASGFNNPLNPGTANISYELEIK